MKHMFDNVWLHQVACQGRTVYYYNDFRIATHLDFIKLLLIWTLPFCDTWIHQKDNEQFIINIPMLLTVNDKDFTIGFGINTDTNHMQMMLNNVMVQSLEVYGINPLDNSG